MLEAHPDWSNRRIAEACAVNPATVDNIRNESSAENRQIEPRMVVRGGKRYHKPELPSTERKPGGNGTKPELTPPSSCTEFHGIGIKHEVNTNNLAEREGNRDARTT